jgi:hypothetical protein
MSFQARAGIGWICLLLTGLCIGTSCPVQGAMPADAEPSRDPAGAANKNDFPQQPEVLVAVVGTAELLAGDVIPLVDNALNRIAEEKGATPAQLEAVRGRFCRQALTEIIENQLAYQGFLQHLSQSQPGDKVAAAERDIRGKIRKVFYEEEVPKLLEEHQTEKLEELDTKLREKGMSLQRRERQFIDYVIGAQFMRGEYTYAKKDPEISAHELRAYYKEHLEDYHRFARARWLQLSVLTSRHPTREAAMSKLEAMGREAYFGGNMQAVARQHSEEPLGSDGGEHDWTRRGSLKSTALDEAIFSLPLDRMSEIIEDDDGFHILKVLEREEERFIPFSEAQDTIRERLVKEKKKAKLEELQLQLQREVPVWALYPDDVPGSLPLPMRAASAADLGGQPPSAAGSPMAPSQSATLTDALE